jgi:hypothetical protein
MSDIEVVLAECLAAIEKKQDAIEGCLARHPDLAGELEPLLRLAADLRAVPAVEPSPTFQQAAVPRLLNLIWAREALRAAPAPATPAGFWERLWSWRPNRALVVRVVLALLVMALLGGGTMATADSLPDSPLYPVKRAAEQVRLRFTPTEIRRAQQLLAFTDERVREMIVAARLNKPLAAERALRDYEGALLLAGSKLQQEWEAGRDVRPVMKALLVRLEKHQAALEKALPQTPARSKPVLLQAILVTQKAQERATEFLENNPP